MTTFQPRAHDGINRCVYNNTCGCRTCVRKTRFRKTWTGLNGSSLTESIAATNAQRLSVGQRFPDYLQAGKDFQTLVAWQDSSRLGSRPIVCVVSLRLIKSWTSWYTCWRISGMAVLSHRLPFLASPTV